MSQRPEDKQVRKIRVSKVYMDPGGPGGWGGGGVSHHLRFYFCYLGECKSARPGLLDKS